MILSKSYDVEVLPNFFSVTIVDLADYLNVFKDACVKDKKGKLSPVPLVQVYTVAEIKTMLASVKVNKFYITDTDDSQLIDMLGCLNNMRAHFLEDKTPVATHMFSYNGSRYDRYMIAALLMYATHTNSTKELITKLYDTSKRIIESQNDYEASRNDYTLKLLNKFNLPYTDVDVMTIFALNKVGTGKDKNGNKIYFPKSLKQTSINLQWYELLEWEMPPISEVDQHLYHRDPQLKGLTYPVLNKLVDKWDRYMIPEWIPDMMRYNVNDVFIVCEMVRLYIDEVRMRYNISNSYGINVLSSSRSNIADKLFTKFYSEFSGLHPKQWQGRKTERTAMSFKKVIFPFISFETPVMQEALADMKKVIVYSIGKEAFTKTVRLGKLDYTIATGGLHSVDKPRFLQSKLIPKINPATNAPFESCLTEKREIDWDKITDDSYVYKHWDIASFYPALMAIYLIAPEHLNAQSFCKLVDWLRTARVTAKWSEETHIDGIPKATFVEVLKIVINAIYGKLGFEKGDLYDRLAVLKVTINGQLFIMMLCEQLELAGIEIISANTDGIVIKLYKKDKQKFEDIANTWKELTKLQADSEDYDIYVNRDINNYCIREINGKIDYKGALHPKMYANNLQKGYDMPVVAEAVVNYFLYNRPILKTLYDCRNILDFCKTQNVGKKFHVEYGRGNEVIAMQRSVRYYVSNNGGSIFKVQNLGDNLGLHRSNLCAGQQVRVLNTLDDDAIERRNIDYTYYFNEALKIIDPIKLGISTTTKGDRTKGTKSGKALIKQFSGQYNTLFDNLDE